MRGQLGWFSWNDWVPLQGSGGVFFVGGEEVLAFVDELAGVPTPENYCGEDVACVVVDVSAVGGELFAPGATMTVRVEVAVLPDWSVAT